MTTTKKRKAETSPEWPIACALWAFLLLEAPLPSLTLFAALWGCKRALSLGSPMTPMGRRAALIACALALSPLMGLFSPQWGNPLMLFLGTASLLWLVWPEAGPLVRIVEDPDRNDKMKKPRKRP